MSRSPNGGRYAGPPNEPPPPYTPQAQYPSMNQQHPYAQQAMYYPPPAPGQYPPPAPGQFPPPPGLYPQLPPGQYPPNVNSGGAFAPQYPMVPQPSISIGPQGFDTVDSEDEDIVCTKENKYPMLVTFINKSGKKASIRWIDEDGNSEKITTLKANARKDIDTWESHPFFAESATDGDDLLINGNFVFIPRKVSGGHNSIKVEITRSPQHVTQLRSPLNGFSVTVKFSNRTKSVVSVRWINTDGLLQPIKDIPPLKAWVFHSCEGHYFTACQKGQDDSPLKLNRGWFYWVQRTPNPQTITKVLITEDYVDLDASSSSD